MRQRRKRNHQKKQNKNYLKNITFSKIQKMEVLESTQKRPFGRLLFDYVTDTYLVFCGLTNQTYIARSYQQAEKFYHKLANSEFF